MKIEFTEVFVKNVKSIKDDKLAAIVSGRLTKLIEKDDFGDHKYLHEKLFEMRIHECGGYRMYYTMKNSNTVVLLLCAGPKSNQKRDIARARKML